MNDVDKKADDMAKRIRAETARQLKRAEDEYYAEVHQRYAHFDRILKMVLVSLGVIGGLSLAILSL